MDVVAASCMVDGGMLAPPGPGAAGEPGSPPGAELLVAGERQAAAVGGRGEEEARLLVQASCRK